MAIKPQKEMCNPSADGCEFHTVDYFEKVMQSIRIKY